MNGPILLCIPVDRSGLPQCPELDAIVITDLYTLKQCGRCGQDVWMGPRQLAYYKVDPDDSIIFCMVCAVHVLPDGGTANLHQLGGGYPTEGRPRT